MAAIIMSAVHGSAALVCTSDQTAYDKWRDAIGNHKMGVTRGPVPADVLPKEYRITQGDKMCDYNSGIVSTRLKAAIESLEPGVHQFHPVTVLHSNGAPYQEPFWAMKICTNIDAILPTSGVEKNIHGTFPGIKPGQDWGWKMIHPSHPNKGDLAVSASIVSKRAIWTDLRMAYINVFVSDALRTVYARDGMNGWEELSYWREE